MPIITAIAASTTANSFVTLVYARDFFEPKLEWRDWGAERFSEEDRERALISATADIDGVCRAAAMADEKYDPVDTEQALVFPRAWDYNDSGTLEIPDDIEDATCWLALHLLRQNEGGDLIDVTAMQEQGVSSLSASGVSVTRSAGVWQGDWPKQVRRLVAPFVRRGGKITTSPTRPRRWTEGWVGN